MAGGVHARKKHHADVRQQALVRQRPAGRVADAQQLRAEALIVVSWWPCADSSCERLVALNLQKFAPAACRVSSSS